MVITNRQFQTASGTKFDLHILSSNHHSELTPADVGIHDRIVVQEMIKEMAQMQNVDGSRTFKVVIIHEADKLSKEAQHGLRRTMEKYTKTLRIVLVCEGTSKLIAPIKSRCLLVRLASPTVDEIAFILQKVAVKEHIALDAAVATKIADASSRNLRKALLMLEAAHASKSLSLDATLPQTDWESFCAQLAVSMMHDVSPAQLLVVRTKMYEILAHCIPPDVILRVVGNNILERVDDTLKCGVVELIAIYVSIIENLDCL